VNRSGAVLVTGGGGFIGSHACIALSDKGYDVVVVDDHSRSSPCSIEIISRLAAGPINSYSLDINNTEDLSAVLRRHAVSAVIHFAAWKAVAESTQIPEEYFDINIGGTASLLRAMRDAGAHRLVFSSSCSIYGDGTQTRDFVFVTDLANGLIRAATTPGVGGEVFQLASGVETSLNDLVGMIREVSGSDLEVKHEPPRAGEIQRNYSLIGKAEHRLGYRPEVVLADGVQRTWQWFTEAGATKGSDPVVA